MSSDDWITDRLPDKSGDYLVSTRNGFVQIARFGYGLYKKQGWSGKHLANCITAWQPLPEAYKGEQNGIQKNQSCT